MRRWAPTATLWTLAFDVREDKPRRRLERLLQDLGFQPVQYSLRLAQLTPGELRRLKEGLKRILGDHAHYVILLPLGAKPPQALVWGAPLGMSQIPWGEHPAHPPECHVGYPPQPRAEAS